jgi:hypothetical protein
MINYYRNSGGSMNESFDDMMRRELGDDFGDEIDMEVDFIELCERYAVPIDGELHILETRMPLLKAFARLRTFADRAETEGVVRAGFRRELEALIVRQIKRLSESE